MDSRSDSRDSSGDGGPEDGPEEIPCVVEGCEAEIDPRGYIGHLRFGHDYSQEQAQRAYSGVKGEGQPAPDGGSGSSTGTVDPGTGVSGSSEDFGEVSQHVAERLEQVADTSAALRMIETLDDQQNDTLDEIEKLARMKELFEDDDDDGGGEMETVVNELRALRSSMGGSGGPSLDLGSNGSDPLTAYIAHGGDDPEMARLLAEKSTDTRGWSETAVEVAERLFEDGTAEDLLNVLAGSVAVEEVETGEGGLGAAREPAAEGRPDVRVSPTQEMVRETMEEQEAGDGGDDVDGEDGEDDVEEDTEAVADGGFYTEEERLRDEIDEKEEELARYRRMLEKLREDNKELRRYLLGAAALAAVVLLFR